MNCESARAHIEELADGALREPLSRAVRAHLEHCAACRGVLAEERGLRTALRALPAPPVAPGFHERVLHRAIATAERRRARRRSAQAAVAASLLLGLILGLVLAPRGGVPNEAVPLALAQTRPVRLVFHAPHAMQDVRLTIRLPAGVELAGYPGRRELSWRTPLRAGTNRLTLPVVATGGHGGDLVAELRHAGTHKRFVIRMDVRGRNGAGLPYTAMPA